MTKLSAQDWIDAGYKRYNQTMFNNADYLLQKLVSDEAGKCYYITVDVYEHFNKSYFRDGMSKFGFQPSVQFRQEGKLTVDIDLLLEENSSLKEIEDQFNTLWEALGKPYYELWDEC